MSEEKMNYRTNGAIGALLDVYEGALNELKNSIRELSVSELQMTMDPLTKDEDCKSIQTVLIHVVQSGYTYAVEIRRSKGENEAYREKVVLGSSEAFCKALEDMFLYTDQVFQDYPDLEITEYEPERKIKVRWGQLFDIEQLMQHAIVHVYRHKRQIDRWKQERL